MMNLRRVNRVVVYLIVYLYIKLTLDFDEVTEGNERLHVIVRLVQTSIRRVEWPKVRSVRSTGRRFILVVIISVKSSGVRVGSTHERVAVRRQLASS